MDMEVGVAIVSEQDEKSAPVHYGHDESFAPECGCVRKEKSQIATEHGRSGFEYIAWQIPTPYRQVYAAFDMIEQLRSRIEKS